MASRWIHNRGRLVGNSPWRGAPDVRALRARQGAWSRSGSMAKRTDARGRRIGLVCALADL